MHFLGNRKPFAPLRSIVHSCSRAIDRRFASCARDAFIQVIECHSLLSSMYAAVPSSAGLRARDAFPGLSKAIPSLSIYTAVPSRAGFASCACLCRQPCHRATHFSGYRKPHPFMQLCHQAPACVPVTHFLRLSIFMQPCHRAPALLYAHVTPMPTAMPSGDTFFRPSKASSIYAAVSSSASLRARDAFPQAIENHSRPHPFTQPRH